MRRDGVRTVVWVTPWVNLDSRDGQIPPQPGSERLHREPAPSYAPARLIHGAGRSATPTATGRRLWVAPVLEDAAREREVALPRGEWIETWSGRRVLGGAEVVADAPLERMPVWVRARSIVVTYPAAHVARGLGDMSEAIGHWSVSAEREVPLREIAQASPNPRG
jgi:hypothetical protein